MKMGLDENQTIQDVQTSLQKPQIFFRYNSPLLQVCLIGLVCFCCPGMFVALSGLGGAGQVDATAANNANTALYATFAIFGILGGGIYNILGPRFTLFAGCSTYILYAASLLYYNHQKKQEFVIAAGVILGIGAGLLWAGQGAIITSYPPQARKGTYISIFWSIFSMGGVIGGLIPFVLNFHRGDDTGGASVNDATYIGFMCFMAIGTFLSLAILPASSVTRDDGTKCSDIKYAKVWSESVEILKLFSNWKMLLLVPGSWAGNFSYTYQFNHVNGGLFSLRSRGLNNICYWAAQMFGSIGIGYILDHGSASRRKRGILGLGVVALFGTAIWGGGLANQLVYPHDLKVNRIDFIKSGKAFVGPSVLYTCYGLLDAMFQSMVYWVIGALADDSITLSRYVGFNRGVQSAGAAVAWHIDTRGVSVMSQLVINWSLTSISYPLLFILILLGVNNRVDGETEATSDAPVPH